MKEDVESNVKQEVKTESGETSKEAAPSGDAPDKKPPTVETEEAKMGSSSSSSKSSKKEHGVKRDGDSDSSATCSADEVEETDSTEKSR